MEKKKTIMLMVMAMSVLLVFGAVAEAQGQGKDKDNKCKAKGNERGITRMTLEAGDSLYHVELWMHDLDTQLVTGYQAFLEYDFESITFDAEQSSYNDDVFSYHFATMDTALVGPGQLNLDGVDFTNVGTSDDILLATLVFTAEERIHPSPVVRFREFDPFVSELSYEGEPIPTLLVDLWRNCWK